MKLLQNILLAKRSVCIRIHENPNLEELEKFNEFIYNFGYHLKGLNAKIHPRPYSLLKSKRY